MAHPSEILSQILDPESARVCRSLIPATWWEGVGRVFLTNEMPEGHEKSLGVAYVNVPQGEIRRSYIFLHKEAIEKGAKLLAAPELGFSYEDALEATKATVLFHELGHHAAENLFGVEREYELAEEEILFFRNFIARRFPHLKEKKVKSLVDVAPLPEQKPKQLYSPPRD